MPRNPANMDWEGGRAALSTAGVSVLAQAKHSATNGANTAYTVTAKNTRRLLLVFAGTYLDIRVEFGAAAVATDFPLLPATYFRVDAAVGDTVQFWNTTGGAIDIYILELA